MAKARATRTDTAARNAALDIIECVAPHAAGSFAIGGYRTRRADGAPDGGITSRWSLDWPIFQYSSGSKIVVTDRSASVMIQMRVPSRSS
jgi:hypothetical protein